MSSASRAVAVVVGVAAVVGASLWGRAVVETTPERKPVLTENKRASGPDPLELLYMKGPVLHRMDVRSGADEVLAELPRADVHAAPLSGRLAFVSDTGGGEQDFEAAPELTVLEPESGRRLELGPGVAPLWSPDGSRLAYLRPVEPRSCAGESCSGAVEVVTYEIGSGRRATLLGPGRWSLLAWTGDRLLAADQERLGSSVVVEPGSRRRLAVAPSSLWGASPNGRWLVTVTRNGASFVELDESSPLERRVEVPLGGQRLAEGSWSGDSKRIAAVLLRVSGGIPRTQLAIMGPERPAPIPVASSAGVIGRPLWSEDEASIAFAQVTGRGGRRLRAMWCPLEASGGCRELLSWKDDVRLLELD
jgi:dipeptidyl aminopeptidase/acylaminoacyl peptidase